MCLYLIKHSSIIFIAIFFFNRKKLFFLSDRGAMVSKLLKEDFSVLLGFKNWFLVGRNWMGFKELWVSIWKKKWHKNVLRVFINLFHLLLNSMFLLELNFMSHENLIFLYWVKKMFFLQEFIFLFLSPVYKWS